MDGYNIKDMRLTFGESAKQIILSGLSKTENRRGKIICPYHDDTEPSMSWDSANSRYHCFACDKTMDIVDYYRDFEHMEIPEAKKRLRELLGVVPITKAIEKKKTFTDINDVKYEPLGTKAIKYMESRGISKKTLDVFGVKQTMRTASNGVYCEHYVFEYYDEKGTRPYVSYRYVGEPMSNEDKGGCIPDTKAILWNMDKVDTQKELIITEGQIDAMSVYEAGFKNVVSIPAGANNLNWIEYCYDWLSSVKKFVLLIDDDKAGYQFADNASKRLGAERCMVVTCAGYNDPNDFLKSEGADKLSRFLQDEVSKKLLGFTNMGKRNKKSNKISIPFETGFRDVDRHLEDLKTSEISIILARTNEGKSTFGSQVIAHALGQNEKVFLYTGEMSDDKTELWLQSQVVGKTAGAYKKEVNKYGDERFLIKDEYSAALEKWYDERWFVFDKDAGKYSYKTVLDVMEKAFKRKGIKLFIIDNLMQIMDDSSGEYFQEQTKVIKAMKQFSTQYNVHVMIMVHPNKDGGEDGVALIKNHINGSSNISALADTVIGIERIRTDYFHETSQEEYILKKGIDKSYALVDENGKFYSAIIRVLKDRESKGYASFYYKFDSMTCRFYNDVTCRTVEYDYKKYIQEAK
jgi:twinkle protein